MAHESLNSPLAARVGPWVSRSGRGSGWFQDQHLVGRATGEPDIVATRGSTHQVRLLCGLDGKMSGGGLRSVAWASVIALDSNSLITLPQRMSAALGPSPIASVRAR